MRETEHRCATIIAHSAHDWRLGYCPGVTNRQHAQRIMANKVSCDVLSVRLSRYGIHVRVTARTKAQWEMVLDAVQTAYDEGYDEGYRAGISLNR